MLTLVCFALDFDWIDLIGMCFVLSNYLVLCLKLVLIDRYKISIDRSRPNEIFHNPRSITNLVNEQWMTWLLRGNLASTNCSSMSTRHSLFNSCILSILSNLSCFNTVHLSKEVKFEKCFVNTPFLKVITPFFFYTHLPIYLTSFKRKVGIVPLILSHFPFLLTITKTMQQSLTYHQWPPNIHQYFQYQQNM